MKEIQKMMILSLLLFFIGSQKAQAQLSVTEALVPGILVYDELALSAVGENVGVYVALKDAEDKRNESVTELRKKMSETLKYYDGSLELFLISVKNNINTLKSQCDRLTQKNKSTILLSYGKSRRAQRLALCQALLTQIENKASFSGDDIVVINGERIQAIFDQEKELFQVKDILDEVEYDLSKTAKLLAILGL